MQESIQMVIQPSSCGKFIYTHFVCGKHIIIKIMVFPLDDNFVFGDNFFFLADNLFFTEGDKKNYSPTNEVSTSTEPPFYL